MRRYLIYIRCNASYDILNSYATNHSEIQYAYGRRVRLTHCDSTARNVAELFSNDIDYMFEEYDVDDLLAYEKEWINYNIDKLCTIYLLNNRYDGDVNMQKLITDDLPVRRFACNGRYYVYKETATLIRLQYNTIKRVGIAYAL